MEKNHQRALAISKIGSLEEGDEIVLAERNFKRKMPRQTPVKVLDIQELKQDYHFDHQIYGHYLPIDNKNNTAISEVAKDSKPGVENGVKLAYNNNLHISQNNLSDTANNKKVDMNKCDCFFTRRCKRRILGLIFAIICILFGVFIAVMFKNLSTSSSFGSVHKKVEKQSFNYPELSFKEKNKYLELNDILKDLFISVKTTKKFHHPRLIILLETWASLVKSQTWFFTDLEDVDMFKRSNGHLIATNCSNSHSRTALACKMAAEYDAFLQSHKRWWCHFDDDNYVHVTKLAELLKQHDSDEPKYLGKPSTAKPLEIFDLKAPHNVSHFWFATGGAGFCISRTLALKMAPYAANGKFLQTGDQFWFPDDVTMGYIIEHLLGEKLTVVPEFHSHLEPMKRINEDTINDQISFSYITYNGVSNVLDLSGPLPMDADPTRFYSLHCRLYSAPFCPEDKIF